MADLWHYYAFANVWKKPSKKYVYKVQYFVLHVNMFCF